MGRRNRKSGNGSELYWQSPTYTNRLFAMYRDMVIAMALQRYKWVNLPSTCDERYLEWTLLFQGVATIAFPKRKPGQFFSTQITNTGKVNVYDNPTKWRSIGNNGWNFNVYPNVNGVLVYDNRLRVPIMERVDLLVRELVDVVRTKQINRMHCKVPYVIKCLQEQEQQAINLYKQIAGFEPAIITTTGFESIDIDVINTGVQFLGAELTAEEMNIWNRIYNALGIKNTTYKAERMIEDEVKTLAEPTDLVALDGLTCRRDAAERLNRRFGEYLDAPISVVWREDNESDNYNAMHNLQSVADIVNTLEQYDDSAGGA